MPLLGADTLADCLTCSNPKERKARSAIAMLTVVRDDPEELDVSSETIRARLGQSLRRWIARLSKADS